MKEIIRFIVDHWQLILSGLLAVISVIVAFIRKRPVKIVDSVKTLIVDALPTFICEAEKFRTNLFGRDYVPNGQDKLEIVRNKVFSLLEDCGIEQQDFDIYWNSVLPLVEEILSTPTKKGGLGREQEKDNA